MWYRYKCHLFCYLLKIRHLKTYISVKLHIGTITWEFDYVFRWHCKSGTSWLIFFFLWKHQKCQSQSWCAYMVIIKVVNLIEDYNTFITNCHYAYLCTAAIKKKRYQIYRSVDNYTFLSSCWAGFVVFFLTKISFLSKPGILLFQADYV